MSEETLADKVRAMWPGCSDEELDDVLWSTTTFPFGNETQVLAQLRLSYETSGGNIEKAISDAHAEIEEAMREYRELYPVDSNMKVDLSHG